MNFSNFTYINICNLLNPYINKNKYYNILEIGAGPGISSKYFINFLNNKLNYFEYTANELLKKYENNLKLLNKCNIIIGSFKKIKNKKYDIIFSTATSVLNDNNINNFYNLCHKDTLIVTININKNKIYKYFKVIKEKKLRLIQNIFILKIPRNLN